MTELKPCPFCGGEVNVHSGSDAFSSPFFEIYCPQCYTSMRWYINVLESDEHNKEGIIQRWNTRASNWHTGTPTEKGDYLCVFQSVWAVEYYWCYWDGAWDIYFDDYDPDTYTIVAWQKIEPYEEN